MSKERSYHETLELGEEAKRLLEPGSMFNRIINGLVLEYHQGLMDAALNSTEAIAAHAGLKALNDVKGRIKMVENDAVVARDKAKKQGSAGT